MLAEKLFALNSFKRQYTALLTLSVCETIPNLVWKNKKADLIENIDWNNMLGIASALAISSNARHLDAALRISQTTLTEECTTPQQKQGAALILLSLTNKLAIDLAIERNCLPVNYEENFSFAHRIQNLKIDFQNSIVLSNEMQLFLNRFQKDVYDGFQTSDALSISAPTSAGKSYILCMIVIEELLKGSKTIVYIVPTRALISQVESDLLLYCSSFNVKEVEVSTVPQTDYDEKKSKVLVFTQERLHWFMQENPLEKIDILIIDEAHKIEDGHRGILLGQKIEEVIESNSDLKVFFSSPFTANPEVFLENINRNNSKIINTDFVSVNQNLIYANQVVRKPQNWFLTFITEDLKLDLGEIELRARPTNERIKISLLSECISGNQTSNIIYANGAAEAEKIALILFELLPEEELSSNINELIKLSKKAIHSQYRLASTLRKRIAFHYGNMPLLIRQEIERLFKIGEIKYLICTSTLLEGVNLPAKSIFIRNPMRGIGNPLNENDFWNLAGRVGRWGKEFSGNIICIEPSKWKIRPTTNKKKQTILKAIDEFEFNPKELIDYINLGSPRHIAEIRPDLDFAFGYYYSKFLDNKLFSQTTIGDDLISLFEDLDNYISLPDNIIKRNPGISPIAQQQLLEYFSGKTNEIETLIPVYPEDENAADGYMNLVGRIGKTIANYPHQLNKTRSILILNWMTGKPLSYIIKSRIKSFGKNPKYENKSVHTLIRETMDEVENFVRFKFAKDSSCYIDVLRHFLKKVGRNDLIKEIPQLTLWLEFGVSQKTHLSLLALGLTRNTVVELSEFIVNTEMNKEEALNWIKESNLTQFELSKIVLQDIQVKVFGPK